MKVELKEIVDQLTEAIELKPGYKVSALIDTDNNDKLCGWMIVQESEDGTITPVDGTKFNNLKELLEAYVCELSQ
jgi:hypothetical protein